jgi:Mannosyltransferase (PIG-V)
MFLHLRNWKSLLSERHPFYGLTIIFLSWKTLLFVAALASPGPGYDTSTTLQLLPSSPFQSELTNISNIPLISKFVRWDAIYYIQVAQRGHLHEQEWAFGQGVSTHLSWSSRRMYHSRFYFIDTAHIRQSFSKPSCRHYRKLL